MTRVLVVDDSALMRRFLSRLFGAQEGYVVATAKDGMEALTMIGSFEPDVVTLDVEMPNMDGLACLDRIMVEHPCPVVMVSALTEHGADETLEALEIGAVDFITKPDGTISLHTEDFAPLILDRVRIAAGIKIRRSSRLADRVRFRSGAAYSRKRVPGRISLISSPSDTLSRDTMVLVGASTGGPPALDAFLSRLPSDFGWPVLIAQHMPQTFTSSFARRLNGLCELTVIEVVRPEIIEAGHVYVGRGDADMIVARRNDELIVMPAPSSADYRWHPSVDRLVASALQHRPAEKLVGILMTGMGNDGAAAMTTLRHAGGHTIAEAEETAVVWGMPGDLIKRGGASDVVALPQIADRLVELSPWR